VRRVGLVVADALEIRPDGLTLEAFIASRARVKGIQGPVGSGKSTASWQSLLVNAVDRQNVSNGARGTTKGARCRKVLVIRNTLKQVKDTVLPTMRQVLLPSIFGQATESGRPKLHVKRPGLDWEILFYGMDDPRDVDDLKSLEVSDIYISEARYIAREVIVNAVERLGRYPPVDAGGCVEPQLIFDTNPPDAGSWLAVISQQSPVPEGLSADDRMAWQMPKGWEFYLQPPAVEEVRDAAGVVTGFVESPWAENLRYLPPGYYAEKIAGRTRSEIESELGNKPGSTRSGKSVWPQYRAEVHGTTGLVPIAGHPLLVGVDFGRTPAAAIGQHVFGQWRVLREIVTDNMGARAFARLLKQSLAGWYPGMDWACWGDPAGENDEQSDDVSPFKVMWSEGVRVIAAPGNNDWVVRRDAVDELLRRMEDGRPAFLLDTAHCPVLGAAMSGQYAYPRMQVAFERYADRPMKNRFSHVADALQYLVLGGGEGRMLMQRTGAAAGRERALARPMRAPDWDPYAMDLGVSW
jgi:hypothetical protein